MSGVPPYFVAIVGGTGSGKTTLARNIEHAMPDRAVAMLAHDSYYLPHPNLSPEEREHLNFDHPRALDNALLVEHLDTLKDGRGIDVPIYDFHTHLRRPNTQRVEPAPVVLLEGILCLADAEVRARMDLKLFVDTDADVRILRRIQRDMAQRGRTFEQVCEQYYETVRPMHIEFVEPCKQWADLIIPEGGNNDQAVSLIISRLAEQVRQFG